MVNIEDKFGFGNIKSLGEAISGLVNPAFSIAAALVVLYFVLAGFKYLTSAGNKEDLASAQKMALYATVGFVVLMAAFLIFQFLLSKLFGINGLQIIGI
ncbi:hypothetical protein HYW42_01100 [Candidatus Daviesbacteria bacterium]|nr:hypothetical protein [Candidatus Daviesbacteria bacterium]